MAHLASQDENGSKRSRSRDFKKFQEYKRKRSISTSGSYSESKASSGLERSLSRRKTRSRRRSGKRKSVRLKQARKMPSIKIRIWLWVGIVALTVIVMMCLFFCSRKGSTKVNSSTKAPANVRSKTRQVEGETKSRVVEPVSAAFGTGELVLLALSTLGPTLTYLLGGKAPATPSVPQTAITAPADDAGRVIGATPSAPDNVVTDAATGDWQYDVHEPATKPANVPTGTTIGGKPSVPLVTDSNLIETGSDGEWTYYQHPVQPKPQIPVHGIFGRSTNTGAIRVNMTPENKAEVIANNGLSQAYCGASTSAIAGNTEWCGTHKTDGPVRECTVQENEWCQNKQWSEFNANNTSGAQYHGQKWMAHMGYKPDPNFLTMEPDIGDYTGDYHG